MSTWIPIYNIQMANNLMKWWRTKFLSGYKQFSVDCNEGRISDTEELLASNPENDQTENSRAACTTPPLQTAQTPTENTSNPTPDVQHHLNLEEFQCDVSVEGGRDKCGSERQEFSFTLYDFDGHGKITKDDIAGLVTTIYEVLGSSVKVPHYGSKTIRVKLTVSPDQRKHVSATVIGEKENKQERKPQSRMKRDVNVTIRNRNCRKNKSKYKEKENKHCCNHRVEPEYNSDDCSEVCSRVSGYVTSDDEEGECSEKHYRHRNNKVRQKRFCKTATPRYTIPNLFLKESKLINQQENCLKSKKVKKRSSSVQRQELLEIIQANMDKNMSFQTARKPCGDHVDLENKQILTPEEKRHRHRSKSVKVQSSAFRYLANIVDPKNLYVDLAALQNSTQLPMSKYQYNKLINAVMCVSNKRVQSANRTQQCNDQSPYAESVPRNFEQSPLKKCSKKNPQVVLGHTSSPHHLRHRNRQEDQARAMAQVVRWLEQEFSSNMNDEQAKSSSWSSNQEKQNSSGANSNLGVERHEHHHVHEHIHHHYHHYQETPIVV